MPNVMDEFQHLEGMTQTQLFERRQQIIGSAPDGDYRKLLDPELQELVAISRFLRKKTSINKPAAPKKAPQLIPTLDQI